MNDPTNCDHASDLLVTVVFLFVCLLVCFNEILPKSPEEEKARSLPIMKNY